LRHAKPSSISALSAAHLDGTRPSAGNTPLVVDPRNLIRRQPRRDNNQRRAKNFSLKPQASSPRPPVKFSYWFRSSPHPREFLHLDHAAFCPNR
jgi:hypothetical protein